MNSIQPEKPISDLGTLFEPQISSVLSSMVRDNAFRLDAGTYSPEGISTNKLLRRGNLKNKKLSDIAHVFGFGPFKRTYIADPEFGIPLLTSAEMMEINPQPKIMAKVDLPKWAEYQVKKGWIAVSCSGTIGNITIIPSKWDGWGMSQDAIRIVPENPYQGLIYTFLRLPFVKHQIVSSKSGSVIDHIYADDLKRLDVPFPEEGVIDKVDHFISRVLDLHEESDNLLWEASIFVNKFNVLEQIREESEKWFDPNKRIESVVVSSKNAIKTNQAGSEYRLDAHFYNPMAQLAIQNIKQAKTEIKTIEDVTERVFMCNRFKRNYVDKDHGIPFLSGKNIIQIRPTGLKYVSVSETKGIDELMLEQSWTLITRSGTIGRTCFTMGNYEDWTATEDIIRVVPNHKLADAGYVYAFLSSEYGKVQILRYRHGSVIDHVTSEQIKKVLIPLPSDKEQKQIGDLVRSAYEKRAEAIRLEDEAQEILMEALSE